ncbi:hypothetical protein A675_01359 [Salmonella enterica subsp. enterica serovar Enteritidis str. 2009K1726]|uniref:Uncharacterized protein n=3 Tax=Salmonella enterica I TaxID=59201 RepID=A0A0F6B6P0_SALT1|nr:hypothetical protein SPAB_03903 [Salmonella enterica subsp. enterica serovar Paratyphi B str. SPB7]ACY90187.1 hypothetical protein STM14_3783 [Salmonella enterica subsp. enterica serovar Typhimurium str. 14028S]EHC47077.1 hypothetical protein LTSEHVI_4150 [Salmonella enterica subsp. enterica serovar Hvittingfoss str. A4-620]EHC87876.1 hypothetical protein LTSEUGA_4378 [Salmonella enterica subsp. enterica serovar Uganda str. R8-3404]EPI90453.1 hypothetical protein A675_01359 [Salmonella enter
MQADQPYRKVDCLPDYQVRSLRFFAFGIMLNARPGVPSCITSAIYR